MQTLKRKKDQSCKLLEQTLREHYQSSHPSAQIDVYRYNSASVRIRIVDPIFKGMRISLRDHEVWPILTRRISKEVRQDITTLLLLAPSELEDSIMNYEFDNPRPSDL